MPAPLDLVGHRFGRLLVLGIEERPDDAYRRRWWRCRCDCGVERTILTGTLRNGHTRSCGCLKADQQTTHGQARAGQRTREYETWQAIIRRCIDPKTIEFARYGGRGIKVCVRWRESFEAFLADMGTRPPARTIDRIDNDRGYSCGKCDDCVARGEPANCRWATRAEQNRNSTLAVMVEFDGRRLCLTDWAAIVGITPQALGARLKRGWPLERALAPRTQPSQQEGP